MAIGMPLRIIFKEDESMNFFLLKIFLTATLSGGSFGGVIQSPKTENEIPEENIELEIEQGKETIEVEVDPFLKAPGKLLSIGDGFEQFIDNPDQLKGADKLVHEMMKTMKRVDEDILGTDFFIEIQYEYLSIYILLGIDHPETHIGVHRDGVTLVYQGDREAVENFLRWAGQQ